MNTKRAASANLQPPRSIPRGITSAFDTVRIAQGRQLLHKLFARSNSFKARTHVANFRIPLFYHATRDGECKVADDPRSSEIQNVMREEKSRGKRRIDTTALQQRQELLKGFREALKLRTEREFVEAIRELGFADDPVKLREALKIWRASS